MLSGGHRGPRAMTLCLVACAVVVIAFAAPSVFGCMNQKAYYEGGGWNWAFSAEQTGPFEYECQKAWQWAELGHLEIEGDEEGEDGNGWCWLYIGDLVPRGIFLASGSATCGSPPPTPDGPCSPAPFYTGCSVGDWTGTYCNASVQGVMNNRCSKYASAPQCCP